MKDVIESLGVPHTEVHVVLGDGAPVELAWRLRDGARVAVYPWFRSIDVGTVGVTHPPPLEPLRFVADGHLGRLARYLRIAGFDTTWEADATDPELARTSAEEGRVLLTRDRGLLKRGEVARGLLVRSGDPARQLREVAVRFDLARRAAPFTRCTRCNAPLRPAEPATVAADVPPRVLERHTAFRRCADCARVYWAGTHTQRMRNLLEQLDGTAR